MVITSDPAAVKTVFTGDPDQLLAGKNNEILRPLLGDRSVLLLDRSEHLRQRRLMLPPFHGERMKAYAETMREVAERQVAAWPRGTAFPVAPSMQAITLEIILRTVFGLTDEARIAPNLAGRINMASMAAAEMSHYEMLRDALERRGVDVVPAMTKYASALENYHRLTTPSTWLEALVKTYIGDALAADFYLEIADTLPAEVADVVRAVLAETGHSQFVVAEVRAAVTASDKQRHRLALWSRRLLGEAITQAQFVLADHDELVDLVISSSEGLAQLSEFFDQLQRTHTSRMQELGLA
jgi:tRNA isopentenyl-2-thiomethyl-A-37 hydroxylase MiaE